MDAWWLAANYLSVGQIYLMANPLLREPLTLEHVKPRVLGRWGTTPGLNFIYMAFQQILKIADLWGISGLRNALESERIFRSAHTGYAIVVGTKPQATL